MANFLLLKSGDILSDLIVIESIKIFSNMPEKFIITLYVIFYSKYTGMSQCLVELLKEMIDVKKQTNFQYYTNSNKRHVSFQRVSENRGKGSNKK